MKRYDQTGTNKDVCDDSHTREVGIQEGEEDEDQPHGTHQDHLSPLITSDNRFVFIVRFLSLFLPWQSQDLVFCCF